MHGVNLVYSYEFPIFVATLAAGVVVFHDDIDGASFVPRRDNDAWYQVYVVRGFRPFQKDAAYNPTFS